MNSNSTSYNCLYCDKPLKGRSDKKFCDDACRNAFHNNLNSPTREVINPIINLLKKNRGIVLNLLEKGQFKITKEELLKAGLDFRYSTEHFVSQDMHYYFYFDVGLKQVSEEEYDLWYRVQYMDNYKFNNRE